MNNIIINMGKCKGCGLCVDVCPKKCLTLSIEFNKTGYHPAVFLKDKNCTACGLCYQVCPDVCIEVYKDSK